MKRAPTAVLFDLDETLSPSFQAIAPSMAVRLSALSTRLPVSIISGAGFERIERDVIAQLSGADFTNFFIFPNSSAECYSYKDGSWIQEYGLNLTDEERGRITATLQQGERELPDVVSAPLYGRRIVDRGAQIAFTIVGESAPADIKASWDPDRAKRLRIREYLAERLPEFDILTGGASTVDITKRGVNKTCGVLWLAKKLGCPASEMLYVGDALYKWGNDEIVISTGIETRLISGPSETEKVIDELLSMVTEK